MYGESGSLWCSASRGAEFCESLGRCSRYIRLTFEPVEVFIPVDAPRWRLEEFAPESHQGGQGGRGADVQK